MAILQITVSDSGPRVHGREAALHSALCRALAEDSGPVTVMIHGYRYLPGHPEHCPHAGIFAPAPRHSDPKVISWPRHLGLLQGSEAGLGIALGWSARGSIWQAFDRAETAGHALSAVLAEIRRMAPDRPVHLIAHSLGARVALTAIRSGQPGDVDRAVLLAAADYGSAARAALASPAGRQTEVLNVTSRENDFYDFLMERLVSPPQNGDRMLGNGCTRLHNMVTLQLDDATSLAALRAEGYPIASPSRRVCHWSPYLRGGVFALYRAVLSGEMPLHRLRGLLPPAPAPRWSRLLPRPPRRPLHGVAVK